MMELIWVLFVGTYMITNVVRMEGHLLLDKSSMLFVSWIF